MSSAARRILWRVTAGALIGWVTAHFTLVVLSLLPLNPIAHAWRGAIDAYVNPVFGQAWTLFSPVPVASDTSAYVRGFYRAGDVEQTTAWVGFTDPLIAAVQRNRLTPLNFPLTVFSKAMASAASLPELFDGDADARERRLDEWTDDAKRPRGLVVLEAGGAAALAAAYPTQQFLRVQVMLAIRPVPRFSEREASATELPTDYVVFRSVAFPAVARWRSN
ncbi:MAG TPA: DUF5819 family protein [Candidatus Kryptonia bacterium]|nr:DUF5819 family protein [Candidatus Kryptonia bacterium]